MSNITQTEHVLFGDLCTYTYILICMLLTINEKRGHGFEEEVGGKVGKEREGRKL